MVNLLKCEPFVSGPSLICFLVGGQINRVRGSCEAESALSAASAWVGGELTHSWCDQAQESFPG